MRWTSRMISMPAAASRIAARGRDWNIVASNVGFRRGGRKRRWTGIPSARLCTKSPCRPRHRCKALCDERWCELWSAGRRQVIANANGMEMRRWSPWRVAGWSFAAGLLALPALAMQFTHEVNWTGFDFLVAGGMIGGVGLA